MTDRAAGERLKRAIHIARAKANILYDTDLAGRAGVSYDTLMNWFEEHRPILSPKTPRVLVRMLGHDPPHDPIRSTSTG